MKSGHILSAPANSPNQLKVVNKIAVSKLTEAAGDGSKTNALCATSISKRN